MEGITGIIHPAQLSPTGADYLRGRQLQTGDVNAAVEGALQGGATEVVVNDSHWVQRNILIENLHPQARLISGSTKPLGMVQGVENADLVFFLGYHAKYGTAYAVADHTWAADTVRDLRINGTSIGESGLNAYLCGHYGVPVGFLSGDQALKAEAECLLPNACIAVVKTATGRWAADCLSIERSRELIRQTASQAVSSASSFKPLESPEPCAVEMDLMISDMADKAESVPGVKRTGGLTVAYESVNITEAFMCFKTVVNVASLYTTF